MKETAISRAWYITAGVLRPMPRVRAHLVVVVDEAIEPALELLGALDILHGQELLHALVEPLGLSEGPGVIGPGVLRLVLFL